MINAGKNDITLNCGDQIGSLNEIEAANVKFDLDVANFKPLDLAELKKGINNIIIDKDLGTMLSSNSLTKHERLLLLAVLSKHKHVFQ